MSRKKVDPRIKTLLENGAKTGHRSFIVMIGDKGKEQIANLHYMLSKAQVAKRPTVLWCFKKELEFSSHRKKRMRQLKKAAKGLKRDKSEIGEDPFELFLTSTDISYYYYHETDRILGNTYGMCVLQDFEALTPNLLARTIETVQGGGLVVLLLKTLASLKQLYTMTMDVHARYRTESLQHDPVARFNERFLLSLPTCANCLVVDDQLDVLPITGNAAREIQPISEAIESAKAGLEELKTQAMHASDQIGKLVNCAKTVDQAKALETLVTILSSQPLRTTISLTAGRGRGKSAALGLALAGALNAGYANIFLTSPSPENLKTVFELLFRGLDALGYEEHLDYDIVQSTQPELAKCIVRVNVHRRNRHRQTILYIQPEDAHLLGQAELVAVDEAAAIPLPLVQALTSGPQTVLMSSTINGYEGTGRSLSLKLLAELRKPGSSRTLRELTLDEPIRYAPGDPVEQWLNRLLCLDAVSSIPKLSAGTLPHPDSCQLYLINRDTLFSFHKAAEVFLQRLISLYVSSHYKNSPNDLQLMSDAPGHFLFVLLPPTAETGASAGLPDILCFMQVCLEGRLSKQSILNSLARGKRAAGDLIPWTVSQQFQDHDFAHLSGARIVRIAVHPEAQSMGYGSRAMQQLELFFKGDLLSVSDPIDPFDGVGQQNDVPGSLEDVPKPKSNLPPLLTRVDQVQPIPLHWLGVSFGLTTQLWKFYKRLAYLPVYLRQTTNDITGEHTAILLKALLSNAGEIECSPNWLPAFNADFTKRFLSLLSFSHFRKLPVSLCLSLVDIKKGKGANVQGNNPTGDSNKGTLKADVSPFDLKRLEGYADNQLDYHMIVDLLPDIARAHFLDNTGSVSLSPVQAAILMALGLQRKSVEEAEKELNLPVSQVLAMFAKSIRKFTVYYRGVYLRDNTVDGGEALENNNRASNMDEKTIMANEHEPESVPTLHMKMRPLSQSLDADLDEAADAISRKLKRKQRELIDALDLNEYTIAGDEKQWNEELARKSTNLDKITVSIASQRESRNDTRADVAKDLYKEHVVRPMEARGKNRKLRH